MLDGTRNHCGGVRRCEALAVDEVEALAEERPAGEAGGGLVLEGEEEVELAGAQAVRGQSASVVEIWCEPTLVDRIERCAQTSLKRSVD